MEGWKRIEGAGPGAIYIHPKRLVDLEGAYHLVRREVVAPKGKKRVGAPVRPRDAPAGMQYVVVDGVTYLEFKKRATKVAATEEVQGMGDVTEGTKDLAERCVEVGMAHFQAKVDRATEQRGQEADKQPEVAVESDNLEANFIEAALVREYSNLSTQELALHIVAAGKALSQKL